MSQKIVTNIITGFLGSGKTSVILNLLAAKPSTERWAVLVNEFGEVGVDGAFLDASRPDKDSVFIREVPGGCMCCAAGVPMQVALTSLLRKAKPDRLLIEPSGLGHPAEVLAILQSEYYRDILDIHKTLTLIDLGKITDPRYLQNQTFQDQIAIADVIVGTKLDLYGEDEKRHLRQYLNEIHCDDREVCYVSEGNIPLEILIGKTKRHTDKTLKLNEADLQEVDMAPLPVGGYLEYKNSGDGFFSCGVRFSPELIFDSKKLFDFFSGLSIDRAKAVMITEEGIKGYNLEGQTLKEYEFDDCLESRAEFITSSAMDGLNGLKDALLACQVSQVN